MTKRRQKLQPILVFYPITAEEIREFWEYIRRRNEEGIRATKLHRAKVKPRKSK